MSHAALWYLSRGTGVVSLVLLTLVVILGVLTRGGIRLPSLPAFVTAGLHRNVALLAVTFLGVHIATAVADPYAPIRLLDAVVPFTSAYRPVWLGLGALALDLLLAVVVTSLLRARLGARVWRAVHWVAYAAWPVAVVHALGTGSDVRQQWLLATVAMSVVSVVWALLWRLVDLRGRHARPGPVRRRHRLRAAAAAAVVGAPLALGAWTVSGPLAAGWAARAGTPAALLRPAAAAATGTPASSARPSGTADITGTLSQQWHGDDDIRVAINGQLSGSSAPALDGGTVQFVLTGRPLGDDGNGGVQLTAGVVTLQAGGSSYTGPVTGLSGGRIAAAVAGPAGRLQVVADVLVDQASSTMSGTVTVV